MKVHRPSFWDSTSCTRVWFHSPREEQGTRINLATLKQVEKLRMLNKQQDSKVQRLWNILTAVTLL
jgi:hypothetical protein